MREVDIALKKIAVRNHNAHVKRASLHGVQLQPITPPKKSEPTDPKAQKAAERQLTESLKRKQEELKRAKS